MATKPHEDEHTGASTTGSAAHQAQPKADKAPVAASTATTRTPEQREAMAAATIGAQVILDYNGDGSIGARGGAGATIEENTAARDAHLIALGLDPNAPSGPPTGVPWEPPAALAAREAPPVPAKATRISSLAAGLLDEPGDLPDAPPPETLSGSAARR
jgi:hypothetical protein